MPKLNAYADNVVLVLEPEVTQIGSLFVAPKQNARGSRTARVVASGPGYHKEPSYGNPHGVFIPNETRPGDRVLIDALAGQNYSLDLSVPRHNKDQAFKDLLGEKGEFRIVRESEILALVDDDVVDAGVVPHASDNTRFGATPGVRDGL